jgi:hypothetical protein
MADKVLFYRISESDYLNEANKTPNQVYWLTDKGRIYLGDRLIAEEGPVKSINGKIGDVKPEITDITNLQLTISGIQTAAINLSDLVTTQNSNLNSTLTTVQTTVTGHGTDISSLQSQQSTNTSDISDIKNKIPAQASVDNKLADKSFVNSSINSLSANYVTYDEDGNPFPTKNDLITASVFYSGKEAYTPTKSDYCLVLKDESAFDPFTNGQVRYVMNNNLWEFQYGVNESPLTSDQLAALNSGITLTAVTSISNKLDKEFLPTDAGKLLEVKTDGMLGLTESDSIERNSNKKNSITNDTTEVFYPSVKAIYDSYGQVFDSSNTITNFINRLYPIGTIYTTVNIDFDPNNIFTGVWTKTGEGKVSVGRRTGSSTERNFEIGEMQTGEYEHTLTENEMPSHKHFMGGPSSTGTSAPNLSSQQVNINNNPVYTASTGGGLPHNNMPPYFVVIFWQRVS